MSDNKFITATGQILNIRKGDSDNKPTVVDFSTGASVKVWPNQLGAFTSPKLEVGAESEYVIELKTNKFNQTEAWLAKWGGQSAASGGGGKRGGGSYGTPPSLQVAMAAYNAAVAMCGPQAKVATVIKTASANADAIIELHRSLIPKLTQEAAPQAAAPAAQQAPSAQATKPQQQEEDEYDPFADE